MLKKMTAIITIAMTAILSAVPVGRDAAEKTAEKWLFGEKAYEAKVAGYEMVSDAVHIFNFENGGFALIAADDASIPVLGYSRTGEFNSSAEKTNINYWLGMYEKAIKEIRSSYLDNSETLKEWDNILSGKKTVSAAKPVETLMTSTWNQSPIYNMYCPMDGGSRSVVGCVATAMAQIMNYHEYPKTGKGSSSYDILGQTLSVDYYLSRYGFSKMPDYLTSGSSTEAKHEVAQLSYHAGVAVEMMYGADGSGAYSNDVPAALKNYFKYSTSTSYADRSSYTATTWRNLLKGQLDNALPVYYSGHGSAGGHAFVCDGYADDNYYHFNWGWGGYSDGNFSIDNLNPGGMTFNDGQAVVYNIVPGTIDIDLNEPISDIQSSEQTHIIDLSAHFSSRSGDTVSYKIDDKSEINGLQYNITGSTLTLNKLYDGVSRIILTCTTRKDNEFDEFYIQFGSNSPQAAFGKNYNFNSTAYINAGNTDSMNGLTRVGFSAWIKLNAAGKDQGIVSKSTSSSNGWYVFIQSNNRIKFLIKNKEGNTRTVYSNQALQAGTWYHLDVWYDGKDMAVYIDGELDILKTSYTTYSDISQELTASLTIGSAYGILFDGQIDEPVVWNGEVSKEMIRKIMGERPSSDLNGLVSYWPLNEGFNNTAEDKSGLNNGTIINGDPALWKDSDAPIYFFMGLDLPLNDKLVGDESETAVFSISSAPTSGSIEITDTTTGLFTYAPAIGFSGVAEFKYEITYGDNTTTEKTVLVSVKDTNGICDDQAQPSTVSLYQNYPNPFNPTTQIRFALAKTADVKLSVYNIAGQQVAQLASGIKNAGIHAVDFDGSRLNSGVYYYTLEIEGRNFSKKMLLVK
jgi:hypothetical protein